MNITKTLLSAVIALFLVGCATTSHVGSTTTPGMPDYDTEADMMLALGNYASSPDVQGFPMIYPTELVNVKVYRDADAGLANFKTYDYDYTSKTNPLLEKELFHQLGKVLQSRGLVRVEKDPQITISMNFFSGKKEQYTPPTTVTSTEIKNVWNTGFWGWNAAGYSSAVPVTSSTTTPGFTTTTYYSNIRLNFLDRSKLIAKGAKLETPPMIWMGEADSEGGQSDIRNIAPVMFNELIKEFPEPTAATQARYVRLFRYGGLGLEFDPQDWRVVRYVEPGSVATENGIEPGDILLSINGDGIGTFVARSLWYTPNSVHYREKDAYYLNILSNKGDAAVNVVVKKAATGSKVTIKMTPRNGDRYIYVNQNGLPLPIQK